MTARLVIYFDDTEDMIRVLKLLKESGLEDIALHAEAEKRQVSPDERDWSLAGSVDLDDKLAGIPNLRDFAYDD